LILSSRNRLKYLNSASDFLSKQHLNLKSARLHVLLSYVLRFIAITCSRSSARQFSVKLTLWQLINQIAFETLWNWLLFMLRFGYFLLEGFLFCMRYKQICIKTRIRNLTKLVNNYWNLIFQGHRDRAFDFPLKKFLEIFTLIFKHPK